MFDKILDPINARIDADNEIDRSRRRSRRRRPSPERREHHRARRHSISVALGYAAGLLILAGGAAKGLDYIDHHEEDVATHLSKERGPNLPPLNPKLGQTATGKVFKIINTNS